MIIRKEINREHISKLERLLIKIFFVEIRVILFVVSYLIKNFANLILIWKASIIKFHLIFNKCFLENFIIVTISDKGLNSISWVSLLNKALMIKETTNNRLNFNNLWELAFLNLRKIRVLICCVTLQGNRTCKFFN